MIEFPKEDAAPAPAVSHAASADTQRLIDQSRKLTELNTWFELALNNMARGLSMFDADQRLIVCNSIYRQIYGLPEEVTTPGASFSKIIAYHAAKTGSHNTADELMKQRLWLDQHALELRHGKVFTHTQHLPNGRIILVTNQPLADGGWVDIQEDITERTMAEERIAWLARHCPLTEIPNRFHVREKLEAEIQRLGANERLAIHFVDLDYFKQVNDTLGHATGDAVLKAVAKRMASTVRDSDFVGRLGGDEFAIIQKEVVDLQQATSLGDRLVKILNAPYRVLGSDAGVGASIGIAICPDHGSDADTLMQRADTALYRVKTCGRGGFAVYQPFDDKVARDRIELQSDLRSALKRSQLVLHYQPVVDVKAGTVTGCEALMRWRHPKLGMLPPATFIPIAEKTGMIASMGEWAIRQACQDAARWHAQIRVSVNISALQFDQGDLPGAVEEALRTSRLDADRLELEITEAALLQREANTLETLRRLRGLGVRLVLDDFGTSFSALNYLQNFSFDKIKIDRSFVDGLTGRRDKMAIVGAVTGLAHALGIGPVAEGVEALDQLQDISGAGCQEMQGFFFSQPVPSSDVDAAIAHCVDKLIRQSAA
jgi:diguanylate cyclase (GGDEF)-like protein